MTQPTPERHESYGKMSFAAGQGSGVHLFGTSIVHSNYVIMEISTALLERNLSQDWVRVRGYTAAGCHVVGPVRGRRHRGRTGRQHARHAAVRPGRRAAAGGPAKAASPGAVPVQRVLEELEAQLSGVLEELEEIAQGATGRLRRRLKGLGDRLRNQLPFLRDQFQRHTNRTVVEARADLGSALAPPADSVALPGLPAAPETEEDGPEMQNNPPGAG